MPRQATRAKPMNNMELVERFCAASAALREKRRLHIESFGTLIPHVFMADVLAHVGACLLPGGVALTPGREGEVAGILEALEEGLAGGDRETRNVISVSFASDAELEPFFRVLKPYLGPRVLGQLQGK